MEGLSGGMATMKETIAQGRMGAGFEGDNFDGNGVVSLGNIRGNSGVQNLNPYPTLHKPLPTSNLWISLVFMRMILLF